MSKLKVNEIEPIVGTQIGVGAPPNSDPSILMNIQSTTQGFALPRMTTAQRNAIPSPSEGLLIYDLDVGQLQQYTNGVWVTAGGGQEPILHVLRVVKNATTGVQDFNSVVAALASITDNSPTNQYVIQVGPGVYTESQIVMKPYVCLIGLSKENCILTPVNPNANFIIGSDSSCLEGVTVTGVTGSARAAVYHIDGIFQVNNCSFIGNTIGVQIEGVTVSPTAVVNNCAFSGTFGNAILVRNNGQPAIASIKNSVIDSTTATSDTLIFSGVGTLVSLSATSLRANFGGYAAVKLSNGVVFQASGFLMADYSVGVTTLTGGANPRLSLIGTTLIGCTSDFQILHSGTFGSISASAESENSFFDPGTVGSLALLLSDPDGDIEISGELKQRQPDSTFTDTTTLSANSSAMGILNNGDINPPVVGFPFTVTVEAGFGYLQKTDGSLKKIVWPDTPFTVPANSVRYLYFDSSATLQGSPTLPNIYQNIVIGRAVADSTGVIILEESGFLSTHASTTIGTALRNGLGAVYANGSTVSEFGTRQLNVTAGEYYYGERQFLAAGGAPVTFITFYQNGSGGFTSVHSQNTVDNVNYDDGSGVLAPLTAGYYAKHSIYALGDSTGDFDSEGYFLVYSQAQYSSLVAAEQGSLPNPPSYLSDAVTLIASVIVQQGATNIVEIRDERPLFSAKRVSSVAATTFHHNLLGLNDFDDHLRYLPVDGSRPMTADLPMGTHNVTNAGTYNGVTVENHHARHQPGSGLDELPTAAAISQTPNQANAIGTSTSLSRADHVHNIPTAAPVTQSADQANADGNAASFSRSNHVHNIPTAVPVTLNPNVINTQGTSSSFAKADHIHNVPTAAAATQGPDNANADGVATTFAKSDHVHNIPTAIPSTLNPDVANTKGTSTSFARADHIHNVPTAAPAQQLADQTNAQGSSTSFARADHIHNIPTAAPIQVNANGSNVQGTSTSFAKADHKHDILTGTPSTQNPDQTNTAGSSSSLARADHIHNIPTASASSIPGNTNSQGSSTSFARADHAHQLTATGAVLDSVPEFDGTNWQATFPEALKNSSRAYNLFDDFMAGVTTTNAGELRWTISVSGSGSTVLSSNAVVANNHPGVVAQTIGASAGRFASLTLGVTPNLVIIGGGAMNIEYDINIPTLSVNGTTNYYTLRLGLGDSTSADFTNGVYFEYNLSISPNWLLKTAAGGTRTQTTTTAVVATGWTRLTVQINAAGTSATFLINGTSVGTISTNLPSVSVGYCSQMVNQSSNAYTMHLDYFSMNQRFTTAR